ncbi:MAG: ABC-2 family transporter protein [Candidatus Cloacimonetes bacterium]|nr:ABC-2 family transporter protein [Candidatus Cloacimonadota bacterium]
MSALLSKWFQTIKISWSNLLAYRLNFFLLIIGPAFVFFFVKYNLWYSIFQGDKTILVGGYTLEQMIHYQFFTLITALIAQSSNGMKLSSDIRLGRISVFLIYPFNFWQYHCAHFLAFQSIQVIVGLLSISIFYYLGLIYNLSMTSCIYGFSFCIIVGVLWFSIQYLIGLMAFWLEETWILRVSFLTISNFLSGAIIPLELYPKWLVNGLWYTPFPYLTFVPVKVFQGQFDMVNTAFFVIVFWTFVFACISYFTWRKGLRLYTGAGM